MKRGKGFIFVLVFLMLAGGVLAMSETISVKATPGDWVKVYVRLLDGPFYDMDEGVSDENGVFETKVFYSLNDPIVNLQILTVRRGSKILDEKILNYDTNKSLDVDCMGTGCITVEKVVEEVVEEVIEEVIEEIVENKSVIVRNGSDEGGLKESVLTGMAMFSKDDGTINWGYSVGGFAVLLFLVVFVVGILHHGKGKDVLDGDEKELAYMEKKVRETAEKIKDVKEGRKRRDKIYEAKVKLAEEERELKELEAGGNEKKIEKQEDVVENAEDKVDDAEDQKD